MLNRKLKKIGTAVICAALLVSTAACRKSPESSLVVNKDFDKLIDEAKGTDTDKVDIKDIAEVKYDNYVTAFEDTSLGVKVNVDAKVDIPKSDHLSVFRVKQVKFTQELIDKVRTELMGDAALYDAYALKIETKSDIEEEIAFLRSSIDNTDDEVSRSEYQRKIDELQGRYDSAPAKIDLQDYPSDGALRATKDIYAEKPYYEWAYSMYPEGDILSAVTDGSNGKYSKLDVYNSSKRSNQLVFTSNKIGYDNVFDSSNITPLIGDLDEIIADKANKEQPENYTGDQIGFTDGSVPRYAQLKGESCTLSQDEAVSAANDLLSKIGLDGFSCYESGIKNSYFCDVSNMPIIVYRTHYTLTYYRNIDGVFLTQSSGTKNNMSAGNDAMIYGKISWPGECIEIDVNDDGIIRFSYFSPIEVTEEVVENAAIKAFDDVRETFEKMMIVSKAGKYTTKVYDIDRVRLSYSRISEADSYDTGLIVPVWDFSGYLETASDGFILSKGKATALAINAIDGSIIDPDLGY